jgi:glycosyltransferase involved in cell wall biosynthesis
VAELSSDISYPRRLWRSAPKPLRHAVNQVITKGAQVVGQARGGLERGPKSGAPICVMGLHRAVLGIGHGARLFQTALNSAGVATTAWDVSSLLTNDVSLPAPASDLGIASTVVTHLNPIEHLHALAVYAGPRPRRGFRVGYWAWETSSLPSDWRSGISAVDEIWCPSHFTAHAVRDLVGTARPVRVVPHPMAARPQAPADKKRFGLSEDKIVFFAACDLHSSVERKNPMGAIEAFARSGCGQRGEGELLVKVHGDFPGSGLKALQSAASKVRGVTILDKKLSADGMASLQSSVDVVLSPHRSEGFGLVMAEAMFAGKPVIATNWSGNMDFMDDTCAALIQSKVVPVADPSGVYKTGTWAQPDLDHAAALIARLATDEAERRRLAVAGAHKIAAFANPQDWQDHVFELLGI